MEILAAYDLTGSLRATAELTGCSHHTVARHVAARDAGRPIAEPAARDRVTDPFLPKIEEWVEGSKGRIRADKAHEKLIALGYEGSERSTRRAIAQVKAAWRLGHVRVHRPWITEPGMWLQYDFGDGPRINGVKTVLFVAWLAWSRFRIVIPLKDRTAPSVFAALDRCFRILGGAPTYVLTDNEKTVTTAHVAGVPVRNQQTLDFARHYGVTVLTCQPADPASKGGVEAAVKLAKADLVPKDTNLRDAYGTFTELEAACEAFMDSVNTQTLDFARHYGVTVLTCQPADPASKGGVEAAVKLAKADIVPTDTNLREAYASFTELEAACEAFMDSVNQREHRTTRRKPTAMLAEERPRLHRVPGTAHTVAFGLSRTVPENTPMVTFENGQYSVPAHLLGARVFVRTHGTGPDEQIIIVHHGPAGPVEVARHRRARPGSPAICDEHFPGTRTRIPGDYTVKARTADEAEFLALGEGARTWLVEAAAAGAQRMNVKMAEAVTLAKIAGTAAVDRALGTAALHGRFAHGDRA